MSDPEASGSMFNIQWNVEYLSPTLSLYRYFHAFPAVV
jgi:hypothetical protein